MGSAPRPWPDPPPCLAELREPVAEELAQLEQRLGQVVDAISDGLDPLREQILAGGKRLRPLVLLLCAHSGQGQVRSAVAPAAAVELVHLASLMHDDVLDEAEQRRGRPSTPVTVGVRRAVLVGDYLAAAAYRELADLSEPCAARALTEAMLGMATAELQAAALRGKLPSEAQYLELIRGKTAGLFGAAAYLGARASRAPEPVAEQLRAYGLSLGLAFQICDDLQDLFGDPQRMGKPTGRDLAAGHYTLPLIAAARGPQARRLAALLASLREAASSRRPASTGADMVRALAELVEESGGADYARERVRQYAGQAVEALPELPTRSQLEGIADYLVSRAG